MKKILSLCLLSAFALALLAGCGNKADKVMLVTLETAFADEDYAIAIAKEKTELMEEVNAALAELKADGTTDAIVAKYIEGKAHDLKFQENAEGMPLLIMATNAAFPPYEFFEGSKIVGIDAEMAAAIADKLGRKLEIEHMEFGSIITSVQTGKADMGMAGMTVREDRLVNINFSDTYATGVQVVIVREGSEITSLDALMAKDAKFIVGTQKDTTGDIIAEEEFGPTRVNKYPTGADAILALTTNKVDCVIIDNEPAKAFIKANNEK